jgi:MFS family permease
MRGLILPMSVVMAPQIMLAAVQHGMAVLAPAFIAEAGLPPEAVGIVGGLSGAGAVWFFAANGALMPVLGPARALTLACLLSAFAACTILTGVPALIFMAAPLVGFAYAVTAPAGSQILAQSAPRHLWGTLFSLRMAGVPAGGAIAGLAGAGLAVAISWRAGLAAMAVLPLLCAGFLALAAGPWLGGPMKGRVRLRRLFAPDNLAAPFRMMRAQPALAQLTFASTGFAAAQSGALIFLTTYLTDSVGLSLALAGALYATLQGASFAGRIAVGVLADRIGSPRRMLVALGAASACGTALLTQADAGLPAWALFAGAAAAGCAMTTWQGLFLAEIAAAAGDGDVGAATSASTFFTFLAYMATPPLFGATAYAFGYHAAYLATGVCVAAAAVFLARAPDTDRVP